MKKLKAYLILNKQLVSSVVLEYETPLAGSGTTYAGRKWLDVNYDIKTVRVVVGDDDKQLFEYDLAHTQSATGIEMFSGEYKEGRMYSWCNLVRGRGRSWGWTTGYRERQAKIEAIPASWHKKQKERVTA